MKLEIRQENNIVFADNYEFRIIEFNSVFFI